MPTITLPTALAMLGGGVLSGAGAGIGSALEAGGAKDAAKISAQGPVRGGSERAGNKGMTSLLPDQTTLEKLGQNSIPLRNPVYGNPLDLNSLSKPQQFGAGFSVGQNQRRFV